MAADAGVSTTDTTVKTTTKAQDLQTSANLLADSVTQKDHAPGKDGGAANAYTLLKTEYDKFVEDKSHTTEDDKKYWEIVSAKLTQNGVLPELALSTGKQTLTGSDLLKDNQPVVPVRHLDDQTLQQTADELHKAIHETSGAAFWEHDDPDKDKIWRLLEPLGQEDRKRLEEIYHDKYDAKGGGDTLRHELKDKLGGDNGSDWRRAEADLNRLDGKTNDAGALMVAITEARGDKDKGNAEIRAVFETLNSEQIANLDADFRKAYGMSYQDALRKANLSDATKDALPILEKGVDNKTKEDIIKLANIAVDRGDRYLFGEALRGDTADAKAARETLMNDENFKNKLAEKFKSQAYEDGEVNKKDSFDKKVDHAALDYLTEGRISLATITSQNTGKWILNNEDNVSLAAKNASQDERDQFSRGRDAAAKDPKQLNDQEKTDAAFYNKIDKAFKDGGSDKQVAIWEDELIHGKDTLIAAVAKTHDDGWGPLSIGSGTNMNDAMTRVEQMSADDFKNLQDPKYYAQFKDSVHKYTDDGEYKRIMDLVDKKLATGDFTKSQDVHRSLSEVIQDNKGHSFLCFGTSYDGKNILDNIENLSADDAKKYQTDEKFRKDVNNLINDNLSDEEKMLAHRLLDQSAKTGQSPKLDGDLEAKFLHDKIHGADAQTLITDAQALLEKDPGLRQRLSTGIDNLKGDDKILKGDIEDALMDSYYKAHPVPPPDGSYGLESAAADKKLEAISDDLITNGKLSLQSKLDLAFPKVELIGEIAKAPEGERNQIRSQLSPKEQEVLDAVVANPNHEMTTADKMRLFVVGDGGNYSDFQQELDKLHKTTNFNAIQDLKDEYSRKYHGDLDNDFLNKIPEKDRHQYTDLLTPANGDGRQTFYDNLHKLLSEDGVAIDGTGSTMQRSIDQTATTLEDYQRIYKTLPLDQQQALDKYFNDSLEQYKASKEKLAEIASTALITAAALTVVVATGGAATPLVMAAAFAAGGITKNLVEKGIEGSDFQMTAENIAKNFVSGGVTAAANFFGGEALGFGKTLGTISETVAGDVIKDVGVNVIKEGGKEAIEKSLPALLAQGGGKIADADLTALVEQVAAKGATQAEKDLLRQSIESSISRQSGTIDGLVNNSKLQQVIKGALESGTTGAVVNAGSTAIDSALNGQPINVQNLLASGLTGFALGSAIHLGFSGIKSGADYFSVSKGPSAPGGEPSLYAVPEQGKVEYVKRGDTVYKIDGDKGEVLKLQDGDVPLKDPPADQKFGVLPTDVPAKPAGDYDPAQVFGREVDPAKVAKLKQDLGISWLDQLTGNAKQKLLDDLNASPRIRAGLGADGPKFYDGNTRYFLAKQMGIADDEIPVWITKNGEPTKTTLGELHRQYDAGEIGKPKVPGTDTAVPELASGPDTMADSFGGKRIVSINGQTLEPGKTYIIGRDSAGKGDILVSGDVVSGQHASIRVDANGNRYITDLNSTNGTYVNGKRITARQEVQLRPSDTVSLGSRALNIQDTTPAFKVQLGSSQLDLKPGEEVQIGRGKDGVNNRIVSTEHAKLGRDGNGYYLVDESRNGTFVTRDGKDIKLTPGKRFYLQEGDEVGLGKSVRDGGERLRLAPEVAAEVAPITSPTPTTEISPRALQQSNEYGQYNEIKGRIEDGWSSAGANAHFNADGSFDKLSRPAMVIDRQNDPVLRAALDEAKARFGNLPPRERAEALTKWAQEKLKPANMSEGSLDAWYSNFNSEHAGERVYFGQFLLEGKGVCSQQAILLKLAADEFPDMSATLIRGNSGGGLDFNHAWTEFDFGDGKPLVFDPRQKFFGVSYDAMPKWNPHTPGRDINAQLGRPNPTVYNTGDVVSFGEAGGWKVQKVQGDNVVITHSGVKDASQNDVLVWNNNKALAIGEKYTLRRSNGTMDDGWILTGRNPDGTLQFSKPDSIVQTVPRDQIDKTTPGTN